MASWFFKSNEPDFNFHDDQTLHGPDSESAWYSNLGGDAVAALKNLPTLLFVSKNAAARDIATELDVDDPLSRKITQKLVSQLWGSMLHPPLSYHGNKFRYRTADGSYNNIMYPDLGKAGMPYAKTVQPKRARQGAKPDPGDLFDLLLARNEKSVESPTGISSLLLYHATLVIHDIFRTDDKDSNKSATSSYIELSPLYGCNQEAQREVRLMKLGLLKPDTFAEERLIRQPPGVCLYIVLYNRFHNYVAKQLLQINENGRFSLPPQPENLTKKELDAWRTAALEQQDEDLFQTARLITCGLFAQISIHDYLKCLMLLHQKDTAWTLDPTRPYPNEDDKHGLQRGEGNMVSAEFNLLYRFHGPISDRDSKWTEDLFTGLLKMGNMIDDNATEEEQAKGVKITTQMARDGEIPIPTLQKLFAKLKDMRKNGAPRAERAWFPDSLDMVGDREGKGWFRRDENGSFDDAQIAAELTRVIEDPIMQWGGNVPKVLKAIEILGILQARKWEMASLNEFREFFGMSRHKHFKDINSDPDIQNKLRDLYEDPDMVEFYPGVMLEGHGQNVDPGTTCPGDESSALWRAVFSDAVTLVRSDRFYTIDFNVDSYTTWGFNEVQSDPKVNKGSVVNRLFLRALPGFFTYNSLHMWQPFYTPTKNAILAEQQGYINQLDLSGLEDQLGAPWVAKNGHIPEGFFKRACGSDAGNPRKIRRTMTLRNQSSGLRWRGNESCPRSKPVITIANYKTIKDILEDTKALNWARASIIDPSDIPHATFRAIIAGTWGSKSEAAAGIVRKTLPSGWEHLISQYFDGLSNDIRLREQRKFQKTRTGEQIYQIDVVKDFATPLITRFFADFLGFWNEVKTEAHIKRPYTENQIYLHITNCQRFNTRDSDSTKLWKRRHAFRDSMQFLINLTEKGVSSYLTRPLEHGLFGTGILRLDRAYSGDPDYVQNFRKLAVTLVQALQSGGFSASEIAAILLAQVLGTGASAVNNFTETLAYFIDPKRRSNQSVDDDARTALWAKLQTIAWKGAKVDKAGARVSGGDGVDEEIRKYALEAQRFNQVELVRIFKPQDHKVKVVKLMNSKIVKGKAIEEEVEIHVGDTVVLDIPNAYFAVQDANVFPKPDAFQLDRPQSSYLSYGSSDLSRSGIIGQQLTVIALTSLLKSTAQWKNLRVAHDKLGRLHRVLTPEGLTRYADVQWGELLPTPLTWNLRFDGLGKGVFSGGDNADQGHGMNQIWQREDIMTDDLENVNPSVSVLESVSVPEIDSNAGGFYSTGFYPDQLVSGWGYDGLVVDKAPTVTVLPVDD